MTTSYGSPIDFYRRGPFAKYVIEMRSAGRVSVDMVRAAKPEGQFRYPAHGNITLVRVLRSAKPLSRDLGTGLKHIKAYHPAEWEVLPPHTPAHVEAEGDHEVSVFVLPFSSISRSARHIVPNFSGDFGRLHDGPFSAPLIAQICSRLWEESAIGNPNGLLFADGAVLTIAAELIRIAGLGDGGKPGPTQVISNHQIDLLDDYIDANIEQSIRVNDLAEIIGMTELSYLKAFKTTTGKTPHQYVLHFRIARAREMLSAEDMALAEVAYACGFSGQSHMTDVFRQKLGVTPGRYRREMRR